MKNKDMNELLDLALNEMENVTTGNEFIIKDLFLGHEWNEVDINLRRNLGRMISFHLPENVVMTEKNSSGQQMYRKQ